MTDNVLYAEKLFGQPRSKHLIAATFAVTHATPYEELMSHFLCVRTVIRDMRALQKKRERDLDPKIWEQAATMEKQIDHMIWSPL